MRCIELCVLFYCQVWPTLCSRTRRHLSRGGDHQPDKLVHAKCGREDNEKLLADALQSAAKLAADESHLVRNPFKVCEPMQPILRLQEIVVAPFNFCALGKLAKNGNFFASADGAVLAKRVNDKEAQVLGDWGDLFLSSAVSEYPGGCPAFSNTLLVPMVMDFVHGGGHYVVMPNLTHYYARVATNNWIVQASYDAKPLPNLGEGLVKLLKGLRNEWGRDLQQVSKWEAWNEVRSQLLIDLQFLEDRVVDFSLFVHVIQYGGAGDASDVPAELSPTKGCVSDPTQKTVLCFRILDFLTPFTWKRELESQYKASKFDDYAKKFLNAFDCIGDISRNDCTNYKAAAAITDAMEVSKAMAKATFIGVQAFPASYACTSEMPRLIGPKRVHLTSTARGGSKRFVGSTWERKVVFYGKVDSDGHEVAKYLQSMASKEAGTGSIRNGCDCSQQNCTDFDCTKIILNYENSQLGDEHPEGAEYLDLDECAKMVNEFSTEGYTTTGDLNKSMDNVLWAPEWKTIIAVRGLPHFRYEHKTALERGILRKCFLKMHYFKCTPEYSEGVYFNYKQHFGTLEVMLLSAREFTGDELAFKRAVRKGFNGIMM